MNERMNELVSNYLEYAAALVRKISRQLPQIVDFEELSAFGRLGLVEAAARYQPDRRIAFETFAYYRIRGAVFDGLRKMASLRPSTRAWIASQESVDAVGEEAGTCAKNDGTAYERFHDAVQTLGAVFVLSGVSEQMMATATDDGENDPSEHAVDDEILKRVRRALTTLDEASAHLIQRHYFDQCSLTQIAREYGVNKSTISRRHAAALAKLRTALQEPVEAAWSDAPRNFSARYSITMAN